MAGTTKMQAVRSFERRIDEYPSSLPTFNRSLGEVTWHLLVAHEHVLYNRQCTNSRTHGLYDAEDLKKSLKHTLIWANKYCEVSDDSDFPTFSMKAYSEATDLLMLGSAYQPIFCMFSMMKNRRPLVSGFVDSQDTLHLEYDPEQLRYEALHFLTAEQQSKGHKSILDDDRTRARVFRSSLQSVIDSCDLISGSRLKYEISRPVYGTVRAVVARNMPGSFRLPKSWEFHGISTLEFRGLFEAMRTLSFIDTVVHREFVNSRKDESGGYPILDSAVWFGTKGDLVERICRYEQELARVKVEEILELLTYDPDAAKPDPALQPIIPWGEMFVIAPQLLLTSSFERNLIALLAREYKDEYDRTTDAYEPAILSELENAFQDRGFRVRSKARVPGIPKLADIDILAYEPALGKLMLAEVKWVIAPGEPYEQLSRADAEEKAIVRQLVPLVDFALSNKLVVLNMIDPQAQEIDGLSVCGLVVMRGFCGMNHELAAKYPTVDAELLLREIQSSRSNQSLLDWMTQREFLPQQNRDYEIHNIPIEFGPYSVVINGIHLKDTS